MCPAHVHLSMLILSAYFIIRQVIENEFFFCIELIFKNITIFQKHTFMFCDSANTIESKFNVRNIGILNSKFLFVFPKIPFNAHHIKYFKHAKFKLVRAKICPYTPFRTPPI